MITFLLYLGWGVALFLVMHYLHNIPPKPYKPYKDKKYITEVETW